MNLQKIKSAYMVATLGKWVQEDALVFGYGSRVADCESHPDDNMPDEMQDANAEFITLAHNLFPLFLEAIEIIQSNHIGNPRAESLLEKLK
jgi:hypothetical protein